MLEPAPTKTEVDEAYNESRARDLIHEAMCPEFARWNLDTMHGRFLRILHEMMDYIEQKRRDEDERAEQVSDMRNLDDRNWWEQQDAAGWKG